MRKVLDTAPLAVTLFLCLYLVFSLAATSLASPSNPIKKPTSNAGLTALGTGGEVGDAAPTFPLKETEKDPPLKEETIEASVSVGDALGRVSEVFLSPYGAAIKYENIYMRNATGVAVDVKNELKTGRKKLTYNEKEPLVLIVHTHATECYMETERGFYTADDKTRNTDNNKNVTAVGERLKKLLEEEGIGVVHDRTHHDNPEYNGSYSRSAKTINEYLKKYPSIKIVIDLHRDSISGEGNEKLKPTVTVDGKKAAQVMLVMGSQTGTVTDFPNWKQNFRLALLFQQKMEQMYPGLARPMYLVSRIYNQNLTEGSMILEVGTEANTLEEALYSADLAGAALVALLEDMK